MLESTEKSQKWISGSAIAFTPAQYVKLEVVVVADALDYM